MGMWKKAFILLTSTLILSGCSLLERKNVAGIQVITSDIPSSLFLDGQYLDKTPYINKTIKPGEYTLKIQPDNQSLIPYETQISLSRGLLTVITWKPAERSEKSGGIIYEMEEIKSSQGELSFLTLPDNAIIRFDQGEQQFSPVVIKNIEPGHHQFEITLPSYEKQQHTINILKGYRINVTAKLAKSEPPTEQTNYQPNPLEENDSATTSALIGNQAVTIQSTGFFQNGTEVLKVREQASASAAILGHSLVGNSYPYLNKTSNGWYKIDFNNQSGWVSEQYAQLGNE